MNERQDETDVPRGGYDLRQRQRRRFHPAGALSRVDVRDINERLLIAGLREQELAATLEAERARLAAILASIGDAVLVVDHDGHPVLTNAAYIQLMETLAIVPALMTADRPPRRRPGAGRRAVTPSPSTSAAWTPTGRAAGGKRAGGQSAAPRTRRGASW